MSPEITLTNHSWLRNPEIDLQRPMASQGYIWYVIDHFLSLQDNINHPLKPPKVSTAYSLF